MLNTMIYQGQHIQGLEKSFDVLNPATLDVIASCSSASSQQVDEAVSGAVAAFQTWQNTSDVEISRMLEQIANDIEADKENIARLITQEQGKPLFLAELEVDLAVYWTKITNQLEIPVLKHTDENGKHMQVYHRPLGVVASVTPWNWPFMIAVWHLIPALKTKNCVINKPSEFTPLSTIRLVEIINRHVPKGVCNLLLGAGEVGSQLTNHVDVAKVTFTGSTPVGKKILAASVEQLRHVVLELGGNDAALVLDDVDVDEIAAKIFMSAFFNAGQTCACIKRVYAHESVYDRLVAKLAEIADSQILGDGLNPETTLGPVQNVNQYRKVQGLLEKALEDGAKIANKQQIAVPEKGYFLRPLILTDMSEDSEIFATEQFGPILPIVKFSDLDDVIVRANQSTYGLGGSVWSSNIEQAAAIASQLQTGTVWINSHSDVSPYAEFGGWKQSGLGCSFSLDGLLEFTHKQAIHIPKN
nr:aldehyde dehydrogenase family protein [Acinetobacter sp. MB5]